MTQKFKKDEPSAYAALLEDSRDVGIELWQFTSGSPLNELLVDTSHLNAKALNKLPKNLRSRDLKKLFLLLKVY